MSAGKFIVADESMSMWYGSSSALLKGHFGPIPHKSYVPRKPRPEGIEFKNASCGVTKIMQMLEIVRRVDSDVKLKYQIRDHDHLDDENYQAWKQAGMLFKYHTAITLRLVERWFDTQRIVVVDSAFGSLATVLAFGSNGLYCIAMVKTATVGYLIEFLRNWKANLPKKQSNGKSITLSSEYVIRGERDNQKHEVIAMGYVMDKKISTVIATTGTSRLGNPRQVVAAHTSSSQGSSSKKKKTHHLQQPTEEGAHQAAAASTTAAAAAAVRNSRDQSSFKITTSMPIKLIITINYGMVC